MWQMRSAESLLNLLSKHLPSLHWDWILCIDLVVVSYFLISSGFIYALGFAITHFTFRFKDTFFAAPLWPKTSLNLLQQQKSREKLLLRYFIWSESQARVLGQSGLAAEARLTPTCIGVSFSCFQTDHFSSNSFSTIFLFVLLFILACSLLHVLLNGKTMYSPLL